MRNILNVLLLSILFLCGQYVGRCSEEERSLNKARIAYKLGRNTGIHVGIRNANKSCGSRELKNKADSLAYKTWYDSHAIYDAGKDGYITVPLIKTGENHGN